MSTILVIPDIHNRVELAEKILKAHEHSVDYAILLGDYFDDFFDTIGDAANTAAWLKDSLQTPNRIHLIGNHDVNYMKPDNGLRCAGFTEEKKYIINTILTPEGWAKLQWFHHEPDGNWLFTHAGVQLDILPEYNLETAPLDVLKFAVKNAERALARKASHPLFEAGFSRGGSQARGGIIWLDWSEFTPSKNSRSFNQVFGHTPRATPQVCFSAEGSVINIPLEDLARHVFQPKPDTLMAYNLDTHLKHYAIITGDKLTIHLSPPNPPKRRKNQIGSFMFSEEGAEES